MIKKEILKEKFNTGDEFYYLHHKNRAVYKIKVIKAVPRKTDEFDYAYELKYSKIWFEITDLVRYSIFDKMDNEDELNKRFKISSTETSRLNRIWFDFEPEYLEYLISITVKNPHIHDIEKKIELFEDIREILRTRPDLYVKHTSKMSESKQFMKWLDSQKM